MAQAKIGDKVKIHYTGRLESGEIFDSSKGREPLAFKIGDKSMIPGFENAVIGMNLGETKIEKIPSKDAYGEHQEQLVFTMDKESLPEDLNVEVGNELDMHGKNGECIPVAVTDLTEDSITLDANHPLAGKDLIFEIQLVEIS